MGTWLLPVPNPQLSPHPSARLHPTVVPKDPSSAQTSWAEPPAHHTQMRCIYEGVPRYYLKRLVLSFLREREPKGKIGKDQTLGQVAIHHPMYREIFPEKDGHIIVQELLIKSDMKNKTPPAITSSDRQLLPNINLFPCRALIDLSRINRGEESTH